MTSYEKQQYVWIQLQALHGGWTQTEMKNVYTKTDAKSDLR